MKRLYRVNVSIDYDFFVWSDDECTAQEVIENNHYAHDEIMDQIRSHNMCAKNISPTDAMDRELIDSIPYGDAPENYVDMTIAEIREREKTKGTSRPIDGPIVDENTALLTSLIAPEKLT